MPIRHDPILTEALARELVPRLDRRRPEALVLDRERRAAELRFGEGPSLFFLLHPEDGQVLFRPGRLEGARLDLEGLRPTACYAPPDERLLRIDLTPGRAGTRHLVVAELHTNQWNLLLVRAPEEEGDEAPWGTVRAVLWPREPGERVLRPGHPYVPLRSGRRWRDAPPDLEEWREALGGVPREELRGEALRGVAGLSALNVDHVLGPLAGDGAAEDGLEEAHRRYVELRRADGAWLLERPRGLQPYVHPLGEADARAVGSLADGMEASVRAGERWGAAGEDEDGAAGAVEPEARELAEALAERAERLARRIESLERELEEGPAPETLREAGNLILARLDEVEKGDETVRLEGFDGEARELELDPALSPSENADRCYDEAARRERALEKLPARIEETRGELERVRAARERLEAEGAPDDEEARDALWELAGGRPVAGEDAGEEGRRLPYRTLTSSGGLEIRVGRGARDNEDLTFHHSHTEDIWLHARQFPGAHVILRWGRKDENPPRRDLMQAAVAAAVNSEARHSGTVAVDWTRRKYVRSPRKSAPGAVIPRNVQTLFVRPDEELVERLRRRSRRG